MTVTSWPYSIPVDHSNNHTVKAKSTAGDDGYLYLFTILLPAYAVIDYPQNTYLEGILCSLLRDTNLSLF